MIFLQKRFIKSIFIFLFVGVSTLGLQAQNSMGVGTTSPNTNAVLHLVSPTNDQGLLIPSLTTSQRLSTAFISKLSNSDKGLMIFDLDEAEFFFWDGTAWTHIGQTQDLSLTGNILTITNNGSATNIDLSPYLDDTDTKLTEAEVDAFADNNGYLKTEVDGSITNEIQVLSKTGSTVNLSNGGGGFTDEVEDADADPFNELQDLQLAGDILTVTNIPSPTEIDLSVYSNTDNQDLGSSSFQTMRTITITGGASTNINVADDDNDPANEIQTISKAGNMVTLSAGGGTFLDDVNDADDDPLNEIQDLLLTGSTLKITNNLSATEIDLSPFAGTNTDNQNLGSSATGTDRTITISGGTSTTIDVADNDNDPANEIQSIAKVGDVITLSGGGGSFTDADADPENEIQDLNLSGNTLTITNNVSATAIDLSSYVGTNTDNQNLGSSASGTNRTITITGGTGTTIDVADNDNDVNNEIQTISKTGSTVSLSSGGGSFTDEKDDADADPLNEIQDLNLSGNILTITNNASPTSINLSAYVNTDKQNLGSSASGTNRTITISGGASTTINVADNDNDATNELELPGQSGNGGKFLNTNGTTVSWTGVSESQWTTSGSNIYFNAGDVGVGTTVPYNRFAVHGVDDTPSTSEGIFLDVVNQSGINGTLSGIRFKKNSVSANERFNSGIFYDGSNLMLATKSNSLATNITSDDVAISINTQKFVGIGTKTPSGLLTLYRNDANSTSSMLNILEANGTSDAAIQFTTQGGSSMSMGIDASDNHSFKISNSTNLGVTNRLTITTSGDIGVGTIAPSAKLDVVGNMELNGALVTPPLGTTNISGTAQILAKPTRRIVRISSTVSGRNIRGISAGEDGQEVLILNLGNFYISLLQSFYPGTGESYDMILSGNSAVPPYGSVHLIYDGTKGVWVEIGRTVNQTVIN